MSFDSFDNERLLNGGHLSIRQAREMLAHADRDDLCWRLDDEEFTAWRDSVIEFDQFRDRAIQQHCRRIVDTGS